MPDIEQLAPGNFINPAYATPQQIEQMRAYATELQKGSVQPTSKTWAGVLAQALMGYSGNANMNNANQLQRQVLQQGANALSGAGQSNPAAGVIMGNPTSPQAGSGAGYGAMGTDANAKLKAAILMQESGNNSNIKPSVSGAQGPGQIMPMTFASLARPGEVISNPDDNRNVSGRLLDSYMTKYGDPARAAVAYFSGPGNVAPPDSPTPWISDRRDPNGKSVSSYVSDVTRRMGGQQMAQNGGRDLSTLYMTPGIPAEVRQRILDNNSPIPVQDVRGRTGVQAGTMGPTGLTPVMPGFEQGFRAPATVGPDGGISTTIVNPAQGGSATSGSVGDQLRGLAKTGQEISQGSAANQAIREGIKDDVQSVQAAFPILQSLEVIENEVKTHGDKMIFGPSADLLTNVKKVVAQHAPGFMSEADIKGLAAQDTLRKQVALLQTAVGRQTGNTDMSLLQGHSSVPNEQNSREGLLAIADMLKQQVQLKNRFVMENLDNYGTPGFNVTKAKADFYRDNPIINPLTHNPIRVDLDNRAKASSTQPKEGDGWGIKR